MRYRTFAVGKIDEELTMNNQIDLALPNLYAKFLSRIDKAGELIIENTGITLYSRLDLLERNSTYQIEGWEPDFFLIGKDGGCRFFYKERFWRHYLYEWFGGIRFTGNETHIFEYFRVCATSEWTLWWYLLIIASVVILSYACVEDIFMKSFEHFD